MSVLIGEENNSDTVAILDHNRMPYKIKLCQQGKNNRSNHQSDQVIKQTVCLFTTHVKCCLLVRLRMND